MSTEDLYQDDVEMLDDYEEPVPEQADQQPHDDEHAEQAFGYADEPEHEEQSGDHHESPMLDSLELDLTLRCGELRLTLAELRRLDAGTILEVSGIAPGHAMLCHGEQVVAEGELVDVEGRLGLQITRLVARS
ncbi:FliM/FliN family flagellar motor switch protein [Pseudomonas fragariae (ex Marin et al. 2024)]|uniref:FliM/FliN family flagellar motor switch protein n=2 Tax=Pseudomonas fragariae (ex Marin et al. 2024) TaxID=3080056 RepID=A0ABU5AZ95_9PSED|nr:MULTISPECIES: FliM/FliN family flagellar motor switch protein [unclassified Pseudomonas]MCW6055965.1 FliM/FliN family flagellar motor switch protein [Pseudomonas fragi]MDV0426038.1 FliM/FliN family flagellar motor switch protein [Pseudomonas sp. 17]MDX9571534.1 FliM/FliN family flagellar motor switch protein [Pseudomonas sp. 21(2023)]MDX9584482.1 FliM/FliN family flagellar motor switch protein [Pseudomonas sp. 19(2023)]MDX9622668.1 FliM/FliN family flagellar motor switch protein [Pseudomona